MRRRGGGHVVCAHVVVGDEVLDEREVAETKCVVEGGVALRVPFVRRCTCDGDS